MYDVTVLGLGYIGLPTAAMFASKGLRVLGVDVNPSVVRSLRQGKVHIVEPGLQELVSDTCEKGALTVSETVHAADVFVIAVPTPINAQGEPDLSYVFSAADSLAPFLSVGSLVILESTCPVGTTEKLSERLQTQRPDLRLAGESRASEVTVNCAYCPERVLPGNVLFELQHNSRIIGGLTDACTRRATDFYRAIVNAACLPTTAPTAELAKLAENSFRDVNIAFANELSIICSKAGIDVRALIQLVNQHPRVNVLQPGAGVGGHCIAVDPWFIVSSYPEEAKLIKQARLTNDLKPQWVVEQVVNWAKQEASPETAPPSIGVFGLSFKPNIDDLRESPALQIFRELLGAGLNVKASEPNLTHYEEVELVDADELCEQSSLCVFLVAHDQFRDLRPSGEYLDFCGILDRGEIK